MTHGLKALPYEYSALEPYLDAQTMELHYSKHHKGYTDKMNVVLEKYPDLDMVSFGPTIKGAHTPGECLHIESTEKFWRFLVEMLKRIPPES